MVKEKEIVKGVQESHVASGIDSRLDVQGHVNVQANNVPATAQVPVEAPAQTFTKRIYKKKFLHRQRPHKRVSPNSINQSHCSSLNSPQIRR